MLPQFLGALVLFATIGICGLSLLIALWASAMRLPMLRRLALLAGTGMAGVYALFWGLGLALAQRTVLPPGEALRFCGLDCHLHVSVDGVERGSELTVLVRFSSNARQAPEYPGKLRFRLVDAEGRQYAPLNQVPDRVLPAGASWTHVLRFPSSRSPSGATLVVTWDHGLDYLVPGSGNPLVQRQHRLALPPG